MKKRTGMAPGSIPGRSIKMNLKKTLALADAVVLVGSFLLLLFGQVHYLVFLAVAAIAALFAYKILPKMK